MTREKAQLMKDILDYLVYVTEHNDISEMSVYVDGDYASLTLGDIHGDNLIFDSHGARIIPRGEKTATPIEEWVS